MNKITRKLRSRSGASMLIALVFMAFCVFIGGSVLASASSNAYRVKHLSDQQQYLQERSAALLLAEELTPASGTFVKLTVYDTATETAEVAIHQSGSETVISSSQGARTITFEVPASLNMTAYQRLMFETAVLRYLEENPCAATDIIVLKNFNYNGTAITTTESFWCRSADGGTIEISAKKDGETAAFDSYQANYACGEDGQIYDFLLDFGEYSQLTVSMNGYTNMNTQTSSPQYTYTGKDNSTGTEYYTKVSKVTEKTDIAWNNPVIKKGGAE